MKDFTVPRSEIDIMCTPQRLYDFVTTPDNWVGTHPATKGVRGDTASPKGLGERWFEIVEIAGVGRVEGEWSVVKAETPRLWQIQANSPDKRLPVTTTITYVIDEKIHEGLASATGVSHFQRDQVASFPDDFPVSDSLRALITSTESNDMYLKAVKERIERAK